MEGPPTISRPSLTQVRDLRLFAAAMNEVLWREVVEGLNLNKTVLAVRTVRVRWRGAGSTDVDDCHI